MLAERVPRGADMPMNYRIAALMLAIATVSGCATRHYGRLETATNEADCAQVAAGLADVHRFRDEVQRRSAFGPEDVLAILLDFGIGNMIEKQSALNSADARAAQLEARQRELACPALITAEHRG